jgi:membrane carboxypeptidase/penicillin-binding protein
VTVVWVGSDDGTPLGLSGARAALPIWTDCMRLAASLEALGEFVVPPAVTFRPLTEPDEPFGSVRPAGAAGAANQRSRVMTGPGDR